MNRKLFSVLIAHYNNSRFLETAIESVIAQTCKNWEIILVDDGSTDGFMDIAGKYLADKRIHLFLNKENKGCGYTKHRCVQLATGEIAAFLDPDDKLAPGALETMMDAHKRYPLHAIIHSTHFICDELLTPKRIAEYVRELPPCIPYLLLNDGRIHHFASFKRELYHKTGGIDTSLLKAVDQDLYYKLEETGPVLFLDQALYYYRIHQGSISNFGKELETTLVHYRVARTACLRRLNNPGNSSLSSKKMTRLYRTRYHKLGIFYAARSRKWPLLLYSLLLYPFVGGLPNVLSYLKKLPLEGKSLLRKTFISNYQIR